MRPRPLARLWDKEMRRGEPQQGLENTKVVRTLRMRTTRPWAGKSEEKHITLLMRLYMIYQVRTRMHPNPLIPRHTWILRVRKTEEGEERT